VILNVEVSGMELKKTAALLTTAHSATSLLREFGTTIDTGGAPIRHVGASSLTFDDDQLTRPRLKTSRFGLLRWSL
jgi:hypothetical protein